MFFVGFLGSGGFFGNVWFLGNLGVLGGKMENVGFGWLVGSTLLGIGIGVRAFSFSGFCFVIWVVR